MKLKFLRDGRTDGKLVFEAGKSYEVDNTSGSASMWISRGFAEEASIIEKTPVVAPKIDVEDEVVITPTEDEIVVEIQDQPEVIEPVAIVEVKSQNKRGNKPKKEI